MDKFYFLMIACVVSFIFIAPPALAQDCAGWSHEKAEVVEEFWEKITPELVQFCINEGVNVNGRDKQGRAPIHFGAKNEDVRVIMVLLDSGADVNALNNGRRTPLHLAAQYNKNPDVIKALLDAGAKVDATFIKLGLTRDMARTPLHQAAKHNPNPDVINLLAEAGADVNLNDGFSIKGVDIDGNTPLHFAARYNTSPEVITALINAGADVNVRDLEFRRTALHLAARRNKNPDVIMTLLQNGANGKAKDANGVTPFALARKNKAVKKSPAYQALKDAQ